MLIHIVPLYAASWLACAAVAAGLEWAQLVRTRPLAGVAGLAKALAIGWVALPIALPARLLTPLARRLCRTRSARRPSDRGCA